MDTIDEAILEAWSRIAPALQQDRARALHRAGRLQNPTLSRPLRPWCLCIRANDTRLDTICLFDTDIPPTASHTIHYDRDALRKLCAPVHIDWPGIELHRAAARLGRTHKLLRAWHTKPPFMVRHQPAQTLGKRGRPIPIVWSSSPLDPNASIGRGPDESVGTLWLNLHDSITDADTLSVRRVPRPSRLPAPAVRPDSPRHDGWNFICPGIDTRPLHLRQYMDPDGNLNPKLPTCGRLVRNLYLPRPVQSIFRLTNDQLAREPCPAFRPDSWACYHCHRVKPIHLSSSLDWGIFIAHLTDGLLFGHEVLRPHDAGLRVDPKFGPLPRSILAREAIIHALSRGLTSRQIADELNTTYAIVQTHLRALFDQHGVRDRKALLRKLNPTPRAPDP